MARWLLIGGAAQALISLILWWALPVRMSFPPYLVTAFLIVAYGAACLKAKRPKISPQA